MKQMSDYFANLEQYKDLEPTIIKHTKIHKVLKAILKIPSIPKDEEYRFKDRSMSLLQIWQNILASEQPTEGAELSEAAKAGTDGEEPATNGAKEDDTEEKEGKTEVEHQESTEDAKVEEPASESKPEDVDTSMTDAPPLDAPKGEAATAPSAPAIAESEETAAATTD